MTQEFRLKKDLTGQRFGDLLAIKPIGRAKNRNILWKCLCTCGEFLNVTQSSLTRGQRSCLLCAVSRRSEKVVTHGMSKTSTYKSWCGMIERCENVNNTRYQAYGGRGISLCERWRSSFENFLEDMGKDRLVHLLTELTIMVIMSQEIVDGQPLKSSLLIDEVTS
ncbi:MAG: hypothetical protein KatS3mg087_0543 [Patescibacteria group bacterium]|nr:MAG: hypothetical protein KatS3mg087_0543 [Patescibacteria group bacterium]